MGITWKKVETPEEIAALCAVAERVWHLTYDELLPPGQVEYMVEKFQSPTEVKGQMTEEVYQYYLAVEGDTDGGFVGFAPRYQGRDEVFLSKVYLTPEFRGRGLVREALALAEAAARQEGLCGIRLTVNKHNTHAYEVYRHYGFETTESVTTDIGQGYVMDDYIMVKHL